jgi:hypothetical protein
MKITPHHPNLRLERWHRQLLYAMFGLLTASGLLWLLAHYGLRAKGEFGPLIHPLEPLSIKLHGLAAMLALFCLGSILHGHIRRALKHRQNIGSGIAMLASMAWLAASGYALYYLVTEDNRTLWSLLHFVPGLALPLLVWWHIRRGRQRA